MRVPFILMVVTVGLKSKFVMLREVSFIFYDIQLKVRAFMLKLNGLPFEIE